MIARGRVVMEADGDGCARLTCLRSEGPLVLRPTSGSIVHLVGGAGGPLGGDVLTLEIVVGPGAELVLRTVAALVALPGSGPAPSVVEIDARVGEGGRLHWLPEPTIAAAGCDHRVRARVTLAAGARLVWREEVVRGRHGETGGSVSSRLAVDRDGRPLVRHQVDVGPDHPSWDSPSVGGGARCAGSLLVVDPRWEGDRSPPSVILDAAAAGAGGAGGVLALAGPAVQVLAVAPRAIALRTLLDADGTLVGVCQ